VWTYAMVCRPRPYPSIVCFETIKGNESGIIARNVSPSSGVENQKRRTREKGRKAVAERDAQMFPSVCSTPPRKGLQALQQVAICTNTRMWSGKSMIESINASHPRVSQASCASHVDSRNAPANAVGPLFGYGADGVVAIALSVATDIALPVNLHSSVCEAALAVDVGSVHGQPI
jgi:hypothetical protein